MYISSSLRDLLQVVPFCQPTVTLGELWLMFCQAQCCHIVVVDQQKRPQGLVFLHHLLPYLFPSSAQVNPSNIDINSQALQQTLEVQQPDLVEPLLILPSDTDLSTLGDYLQQLQQTKNHPSDTFPPLAIVDRESQFLGLLDTHSFLQSQTQQLIATVRPHPQPQPQIITSCLQDLLEQLPIPLMIQSNEGEVILHNEAWESHLKTSSESVRQTAETVVHFSQNSAQLSDEIPEITSTNYSTQAIPSWCQPGPQPDTYICICHTADEQEQVWQFTRQPLKPQLSQLLISQLGDQLWLILAQDITEQYRVAEELAIKNADLVHLNRLKDEFLACISHELKTPLTAILGLSKLLNEPLLGNLNQRQAHYAQLIYQSGRHLMSVVNDILDLTRIETEQLELSLGVVRIQDVCDQGFAMAVGQQHEQNRSQTYQSLTEAADDKIALAKQRFTLEIDPGLDCLVADELRLRQMLAHLLSNAIKFTPQPGKLGLRVSLWDHWIAFTVWDEGIGIPEDKQHLIFQKFQQLQSPLTREYQGTGLGLVLTQRLAHLHGGDVSFISQVGQGSQFTLLLPPSPPVSDGQIPSDLPQIQYHFQSHISSRLVLIVEAVPRFIHHLSEQLNQMGYQVVIARSGTEALEKARCLQPHVIFLNPLLPLLSGWDVLTLLKTDEQTHQIPVVITATLGDKKRAVQNQSNGFLCLPVQFPELQKTLAVFNQQSLPPVNQKLTILWLNPIDDDNNEVETQQTNEITDQYSSSILHHCSRCRILEADDLIQAELLARIWQPDVVVLQNLSHIQSPANFFSEFIQHERLTNLPLITLDTSATQFANQVDLLSVFPCLIENLNIKSEAAIESALLRVIQLAIGMNRQRSILLVDLVTLSECSDDQFSTTREVNNKIDHALIHYLETAGFRGIMGNSWAEVTQSIQSQTVDLLLICTGENTMNTLQKELKNIEKLNASVPIFVWDRSESKHSTNPTANSDQQSSKNNHSRITKVSATAATEINQLIEHLGIQMLPSQTSIVELLNKIRQHFQLRH
ncbi:MAG: ATP-binding protein [Microcoleaceae cyanobacterium]